MSNIRPTLPNIMNTYVHVYCIIVCVIIYSLFNAYRIPAKESLYADRVKIKVDITCSVFLSEKLNEII